MDGSWSGSGAAACVTAPRSSVTSTLCGALPAHDTAIERAAGSVARPTGYLQPVRAREVLRASAVVWEETLGIPQDSVRHLWATILGVPRSVCQASLGLETPNHRASRRATMARLHRSRAAPLPLRGAPLPSRSRTGTSGFLTGVGGPKTSGFWTRRISHCAAPGARWRPCAAARLRGGARRRRSSRVERGLP